MSDRKQGGLWETIRTIFYAVAIAVVIRTVAFEPFNIPSGSGGLGSYYKLSFFERD